MSASKFKSLLKRNDGVIIIYTMFIFKLKFDVKLGFKLKNIFLWHFAKILKCTYDLV